MRLLSVVLCVVALLAVGPPALCSFSGLLIIPTTDVVPTGEYLSVEYQSDGSIAHRRLDLRLLNTEFGLSDRVEAGLDFDLSGKSSNRFLPNAKYAFANDPRRGVTAAAGVFTVQTQIVSAAYVVMGLDMHAFRLFAGAQRAQGESNWFVGADKALSHRFALMADYTQGAPNFSSVGLVYNATERLAITLGAEFPNIAGDTRLSFHLTYTAPWRR